MLQLESKNALKQPSKQATSYTKKGLLADPKTPNARRGSSSAFPSSNVSMLSNTNQNTTFAPINITQANPGVLTLGGGGGGGIAITQTVQNTSQTSLSQQITNTYSENITNQITETVSNIANYITGGTGSISPASITPYSSSSSIPTTTVSPTQKTDQTATPSLTASASGGGKTDYMTILIVGAVVLGAAYFFFNKKR